MVSERAEPETPCKLILGSVSGLDLEGLFTGGGGGHLKPQARSERRKP